MFTYAIDDETHLSLVEPHHAGALQAWAETVTTEAEARETLDNLRGTLARGKGVQAFIWHKGELAGQMGIALRDHATRAGELTCWPGLAPDETILAAARALLDYGFGTLGLNRIASHRPPEDAAVAEHLGFVLEGLLRRADVNGDVVIHSLLAEEWQVEHDVHFAYRFDEGLELRLFEARHAEAAFALVEANREHLRRWLPWVDGSTTVEDTLAFIRGGLKQYGNHDGFQAGIWSDGDLAGAIGYHGWNFVDRKTEIGYWLGEAFTGRGIMTRAVRALVDYAFGPLALHRVEIPCATGNTASCAIPERLGFTHEGVIRDAEWLYDHFVDWNMYAILADEWEAG